MALELKWKNARVTAENVEVVAQRCLRRVSELRKTAREKDYSSPACAVALPFEGKFLRESTSLAKEHRDTSLLVVIGIGGSNLGTMAVEHAMRGDMAPREGEQRPKVMYADTVDSSQLSVIKREINATAKRGEKTLLNVISKSGSTTETIANFAVLYGELKNSYSNPAKQVVVTTDTESKLEEVAKINKFPVLNIPQQLGGRYSVFSNVGLFPLAVAGVNCRTLLKGAGKMQSRCFSANWRSNPAAITASLIYKHRLHDRRINNSFYFSNGLENCGKWHAQLMAESIGKKQNNAGMTVREGVLPVVTLAGDLHRIGQLFYAGQNNVFHKLVKTRTGEKVEIPRGSVKGIGKLVSNIEGRQLNVVMNAIATGVEKSMAAQGIPFFEISLDNCKEHSIGELMQMEINETILLGWLLHVNPFDQPDVEHYKAETRRILARK